MEISFQIPSPDSSSFSGLFRILDKRSEELHIQSFSISITTLQEVFLRVTEHAKDNDHTQSVKSMFSPSMSAMSTTKNTIEDIFNQGSLTGADLIRPVFWAHFLTLLIKRAQFAKQDLRPIMCNTVIPIMIFFCWNRHSEFCHLHREPEDVPS